MKLKELMRCYDFDSGNLIVNIYVSEVDKLYNVLCCEMEDSTCKAKIQKTDKSVVLTFLIQNEFFYLMYDVVGEFYISKVGINCLNDLLVEIHAGN